jgi:hypothetical protein
MRIFKALLLALLFVSHGAMAITPDEVRQQFPLIQSGQCTDNESGEHGVCYLFATGESFYLVFTQNGAPIFMRHVVPPDDYQEVWRAKPPGVSL